MYGTDPYGATPFGGGGMILRKISEDATTITLGWDPAGDLGYRFTREKAAGRYSHTWDATRSSAKFSKDSAWYSVEAFSAMGEGIYPAPEPPPPPLAGWEGWGFNIANASQLVTPGGRRGELQRGWDVGARFPRIDGDRAEADLCRSIGFKKWIVILGGGKNFPSASNTIDYLNAYPEAWAEPTNEINLGSDWTPTTHAAAQKQWYSTVKAAHPNATLLLASIGNSESRYQGLTPIQWCKGLADNGCVPGKGFDVANYHAYEQPMSWYKWRGSGSIQELFGNPRHVFSEWGRRSDSSEDDQATVVGKMMDWIREDPLCVGGHIYAVGDDAEGGPHGSAPYGWGLYKLDGQPKKAAAVFKARTT